jgi:hypothetical protein
MRGLRAVEVDPAIDIVHVGPLWLGGRSRLASTLSSRLAAEDRPRTPQDTLLHRLVREHLATFVAPTEAPRAAPLPRYVKDAFERYLACGDFSGGFVRCPCDACRHDVLVAFSCQQRGLCPSCGARRMCDVAANVTDAILPSAPVRHGVLSLPFELRGPAPRTSGFVAARPRGSSDAKEARPEPAFR